MNLSGGCLCGAVSFELSAPPLDAGYCHCTRCQRRTGTAAAASARIDAATVRMLSGARHVIGWLPSGGGSEKRFCELCGGHLFSRDPANPGRMSVRLGALDGDPAIRPRWRQFVAYAAAWEKIPDDGLPRYPEAKPD